MNEPIWLEKNKAYHSKKYLKSVFFMSISVVFFTFMIASIRVVSKEVDPLIIVFFRNFFGIIIIAPIIASHGIKLLRTRKTNLFRAKKNPQPRRGLFQHITGKPRGRIKGRLIGFAGDAGSHQGPPCWWPGRQILQPRQYPFMAWRPVDFWDV